MGDIRIDVSFLTHRKRKRLQRQLGPQGIVSLIDLWISAAQSRPKGILYGMDVSDIASDAQWPGDAQEFCAAVHRIFSNRSYHRTPGRDANG